MAHLGMTNGYYSLSPYATLSLFPHNQPPPQVYHSAQMQPPAELQRQQQTMLQEQQHEQQLYSQDQQEEPKLAVQDALASIPGTEQEMAPDPGYHINTSNTVSDDTQAHGSRNDENTSSPLQLSHAT